MCGSKSRIGKRYVWVYFFAGYILGKIEIYLLSKIQYSVMKFDENFSAVHGYLCADGYVIKNPESQKHKYYHIALRNTNDILLQDFSNRFFVIFGVRPIICKDGRARVQSKEIFYKLTKNSSFYSKEWTLPKLSKNNLRFWLRAFFDCEAWVEVEKGKNRRIGMDSINQTGLMKIHNQLSDNFKIDSIIKEKKNGKIFRLCIFGKENLIKFSDEIGFLHPAKKEKLRQAIDSYQVYEWKFPEEEVKLRKFIINLMKERTKVKKPYIIRVTSIIKGNLSSLSNSLKELFEIESKIYERVNSDGREYYEMTIQKIESVKKVLKNGLLDEENKNKVKLPK